MHACVRVSVTRDSRAGIPGLGSADFGPVILRCGEGSVDCSMSNSRSGAHPLGFSKNHPVEQLQLCPGLANCPLAGTRYPEENYCVRGKGTVRGSLHTPVGRLHPLEVIPHNRPFI